MTKELLNTTDILNVQIGVLAKYEVADLNHLLVEATETLEKAKRLKQWLHTAIALKYDVYIHAKRARLEKDTGIINYEDKGFKITNDIPKKVEWQQNILGKIAGNILAQGGKLSDYIEVYYHVPEAKYNGLPQLFKDMLAPARVIKLGNPIYKITPLNQEGSL